MRRVARAVLWIVAGLLVLAAVMITGSPPFGLFFSEMTILRAGFLGAHVKVTAVFLAAALEQPLLLGGTADFEFADDDEGGVGPRDVGPGPDGDGRGGGPRARPVWDVLFRPDAADRALARARLHRAIVFVRLILFCSCTMP